MSRTWKQRGENQSGHAPAGINGETASMARTASSGQLMVEQAWDQTGRCG